MSIVASYGLWAVLLAAPQITPMRADRVDVTKVTRVRFPGADAVVISDVGRVRFTSNTSPSEGVRYTRSVRLRVLTPGGRTRARVTIPLNHWTQLEKLSARSYAPDDTRVASLDAGDIAYVTTAPLAGQLYSDNRIAIFDVPGVDSGDVAEYEYTLLINQAFALPSWTFDGALPVLRSTFEILEPKDWRLRWGSTRNAVAETLDPEIEETASGRRMIWQKHDIAALEPEPLSMPVGQLAQRLAIGVESALGKVHFAAWSDVGEWYRDLVRAVDRPPHDAFQALDATLAKAGDGLEVERIFELVRQRIRYVANHKGIGAFQPHSPSAVFAARYGDCKDMVTLLLALYRHRGLTAWPVLMQTREHRSFLTDVPSVGAFNHVIAAVRDGDQLRYVDPTDKLAPFGRLPWELQGQPGLIVRADDAELVTLPFDTSNDNIEQVTWSLNRDGTGQLEVRLSGLSASAWRPHLGRAGPGLVSHVRDAWFDNVHASIRRTWIETDDNTPGGLRIIADLMWPDPIHRVGDRGFLAMGPFFHSVPEIRVPAARASPVLLGTPHVRIDRVRLSQRPGESLVHMPAEHALSNDAFELVVRTSVDNRALVVERKVAVKTPKLSAGALTNVEDLGRIMATVSRDAIVLEQADAPVEDKP